MYLGAVLTAVQKFRLLDIHPSSTYFTGIALVMLCLSLVLFAYVRGKLQGWLSRGVFRRSNLDASVSRIAGIAVSVGSERELLMRYS